MNSFSEKINILWIDDCDNGDDAYMYPEKRLPDEYIDYFQIVSHKDIPGPSTIRTPKDFWPCFQDFWKFKKTDIFPPEIIAMDYNLQKWSDNSVNVENVYQEPTFPAILDATPASDSGGLTEVTNEDSGAMKANGNVGFEGLIIGLFSASMMHSHPIGIVPMTNYGDLLENIPEVKAFHLISRKILHVDFSEFGVSGDDRSWSRVLKKGVQSLRARLEFLYQNGKIVISPNDLMELSVNISHPSLTVYSDHATRRLPVQGLFIDEPQGEQRNAKIKKWAEKLLDLVVDSDVFRDARELSKMIWDTYLDVARVEERRELSLLALQKNDNSLLSSIRYDKLAQKYEVKSNKCKVFCDISFSSSTKIYSIHARRLAAILVIAEFLKDKLKLRDLLSKETALTESRMRDEGPVVRPEDVYLALYPLPESPLVLPWDQGEKIDKSFGWVKYMSRWKDKKTGESYALHIPDVLAGNGWSPDGPHGLKKSERVLLRGLILDELSLNISEDDLREYGPTRRVLYGAIDEEGERDE